MAELKVVIKITIYRSYLCKDAFSRVGNFRQKNNSAENEIDGTNGYFRWNAGCYPEPKTLGIPFQGTKIEASSLNSVLNPSAEEKTTRNFVLWSKNRLSEFGSKPFRGREQNPEFH
jgi:hypothetical protein